MCFDIDVKKFTVEELRSFLNGIGIILSRPAVVARLPNEGHQLKLTRQKIQDEILFRENLVRTHKLAKKQAIKCSSESNIDRAEKFRLCSLQTQGKRFRNLNSNLTYERRIPSGRTESMPELRTGIEELKLAASVEEQRNEDKQNKMERINMKAKRFVLSTKAASVKNLVSDSDGEANAKENDDIVKLNNIQDAAELELAVRIFIFKGHGEDSDQQAGPSSRN